MVFDLRSGQLFIAVCSAPLANAPVKAWCGAFKALKLGAQLGQNNAHGAIRGELWIILIVCVMQKLV